MEQQDRKRFAACLLACAEIYGKPISDSLASVWWASLKTWDIDAVEDAFGRHFRSPDTGQFAPKPADIIKLLAGTAIDASMQAWGKVDAAVRRVGPYASVTFDDPIAQRVVEDMGGWISLGTKDDDGWPFVGNEFRTRYQAYRSRGETPQHQARLIGIAEAENARRGLKSPEILGREHVLIGDQSRARQVALSGVDKPMIGISRVGDATNDDDNILRLSVKR